MATYKKLLKDKDGNSIIPVTERDVYSTTEQIVGQWIDGKPIYRKTIDVGALPNNTTKNVAHNISNLGYVVDARGFASSTWGAFYPIPTIYPASDASYNTMLAVTSTNIELICGANNSAKSGYVTIWYTKTTD